jgi:hypothetical protein
MIGAIQEKAAACATSAATQFQNMRLYFTTTVFRLKAGLIRLAVWLSIVGG